MNPVLSQELMTLPSDQDASGRTFGAEELELLAEVLKSGTLTTTKGKFGKTLEKKFAEKMGAKHAYACTSGTAAIHCAIAAINPNPGDEIVTTAITDMGALTPIVYQGAIPVFADVDPRTCNVTAETIERVLSERTKAIIVTHLFGNPCEMQPIMELARARKIPVIEDTAQAFLAEENGKFAGTIGDIGCYSLQQGKHITTGEGGMVVTNDDALARRMFLFINKAWGYGDANPDHYFLALNYRISELQAAVAVAQMEKLDFSVSNRVQTAEKLTEMLRGIDGVETPHVNEGAKHVYWKYCLRVDDAKIEGGAVGMAKLLKEKNIFSAPRYIVKPAFMCEVFQKQNTFGDSCFPFNLARAEAVDYATEKFPGTFKGLHDILVLPWNERYNDEHVAYIASAVREAAQKLKMN
ncbi:MAG: DegT/DnrJ/EryC1/StrS family aminotransferase [Acidobacteriota bacterium]|nr:DegT/DnrJ/EryC1/StrS family aminotransferase [Acidobacteriota bacterium]